MLHVGFGPSALLLRPGRDPGAWVGALGLRAVRSGWHVQPDSVRVDPDRRCDVLLSTPGGAWHHRHLWADHILPPLLRQGVRGERVGESTRSRSHAEVSMEARVMP